MAAEKAISGAAAVAHSALDSDLGTLRENAEAWAGLDLERRIRYAEGLLAGFHRVAAGQVAAAIEAKGDGAAAHELAAEEWISGPVITLRTTRLLIRSLREILERGAIDVGERAFRSRPGNRTALRVFPTSPMDRILYRGFRGDVWMPPGVEPEAVIEGMLPTYLRGDRIGRVALVLGAGNVASIAPLDALHKLFNEGRVVELKLNPVNSYLQPFFEDAFSELIADGFVRIHPGGPEVGEYLCLHPEVDEIHITGSARTHDVILFGPGEEGRQRKARNDPRLLKRLTSELGNVSPVIVLPGPWSAADLEFHAENLVTQMTHNAGFNCNATKVLLTWKEWPLRDRLIGRIESHLAALPKREAYYPGAGRRFDRFVAAYPRAHRFGSRATGRVPPTLLVGLDPEEGGIALREESFCTFTSEVPLGGQDPREFLRRAVDYCNERLYGTLNVGLIVHPETRRFLGRDLGQAIADLQYGTVAINHWPAIGFALGCIPWGGFPGHTLDDVQSGIGVVHNTLFIDRPERSVIDGPFRVTPKPIWFTSHRHAAEAARHLAALEYDQSPRHLAGLFWNALRS
jgi:Aldehyde dehydrogenase family